MMCLKSVVVQSNAGAVVVTLWLESTSSTEIFVSLAFLFGFGGLPLFFASV
jgi:hypothetical protein